MVIVENKDFGQEVEVFTGSKGMSGYFETGLECRKARLAYFLTAAYFPSITKQSYLIFSQKSNIFYTRQAWVKMTDESVKAPLGSDFIQTYPYSISLGIRLNL